MNAMVMNTPVGSMYLTADQQGICEIRLLREGESVQASGSCDLLHEAQAQLSAYFSGSRRSFDLPLHAAGTAFERSVWTALAGIPYGEIRSYGQIAAQLGRPSAARAVGGACSRNPLHIVIPCHRVVASSGRLTGFAAGIPAKRALLEHEGWKTDHDIVCGRR